MLAKRMALDPAWYRPHHLQAVAVVKADLCYGLGPFQIIQAMYIAAGMLRTIMAPPPVARGAVASALPHHLGSALDTKLYRIQGRRVAHTNP